MATYDRLELNSLAVDFGVCAINYYFITFTYRKGYMVTNSEKESQSKVENCEEIS